MSIWSDLGTRLRWLVDRRREERELREELRFHLDMAAEANRRAGSSEPDAERAARLALGGATQTEEAMRDAYGTRPLDDVARDVRFATRVLRRSPAYAAATILTFALGIGAATTIFTLVYGVLGRPLPYAHPEQLVTLWERDVQRGKDRNVVSVPNFEAWRDRSRSYSALAALVPDPVTLTGGSTPERIVGAQVSPGYFAMLGVAPAIGREFTLDEAQQGADVVVLSNALWQSQFDGRRDVIGRTITFDGRPRTIVGVMPRDFEPPRFGWLDAQAFWAPFTPNQSNRSWGRFLLVVGRLRPGIEPASARAELLALAARRAAEEPADRGWSATLVPLTEQITGDVRPAMLVLLGAVSLLLVVATGNVAILSLAHARRREYELAVRRAIGATRGRLVRQLLAQSAVVGAAGAAVGVAAAWLGVRAMLALLPGDVPRLGDIRLDRPVLLAAIAGTVLATIAFGVVAALRGTSSSRAAGSGARVSRRSGSGSLVTAEVALAVILGVGAGLAARSFAALRAVDVGFEGDGAVAARVSLDPQRFGTSGAPWGFWRDLLAKLRSEPGVTSVGAISSRPLGGIGPATTIGDPAHPLPPGRVAPTADIRWADPGAFQALHIPVLAGAVPFPRGDTTGIVRVAISRATARALWNDEHVVGRRISVQLFGNIEAEVAAVVADVHLIDVRTDPRPTVYLPIDRWPNSTMDIVIRGDASPDLIATTLRRAVAALDRTAPVSQVATLEGLVGRSLSRDRFSTLVLEAFACAALLLAAVGIYGVCAGEVASRRRELGIRRALGAQGTALVADVVRRGVFDAALGLAIGLVAAALGARLMTALLFGVSPFDPVAFAEAAVAALGLTLLATVLPALRAVRVSPVEVMKAE